ncbi:GNAT family N-acetyltransferase [Acinetobacter equi]|uniref:N-acetyltransferase domain-containing protein n=1 Tax=Acinetobacter equi TaxID=1324350 RepID=A0A0N7GY04_9GAMM|nr:GNAT family N-acetyltransferase [Acinetobacter equi]ALH96163.1 hypothetical protein AOY20_11820 [Acinetobacter equi]
MDKIKIMGKLNHDQIELSWIDQKDAYDLFQAILGSIQLLRVFPASLPWSLEIPSLESAMQYCERCMLDAQNKHAFTYIIRLKSDGSFVGVIGLHQIQWDIPCITVGFWANLKFHGKGYMTCALQYLINFLKEELKVKRIEAFVDIENERARRLCLRSGFVLEEILEKSAKNPQDGSLRDIGLFVNTRQ